MDLPGRRSASVAPANRTLVRRRQSRVLRFLGSHRHRVTVDDRPEAHSEPETALAVLEVTTEELASRVGAEP